MERLRDLRLVAKIKRGDESALIKVIELYGPLLKTIIYKNLKYSSTSREEVLNDCFLKIWQNIGCFDPIKGSFKNWICAIAKYESIDRIRKDYNKYKLVSLDHIDLKEDDINFEYLLRQDLYDQTLDLIESLNDRERKIFLDLFFEGMSYEEVGQKYGIEISNLYNIVSRSRQKLKKIYKEESDEG